MDGQEGNKETQNGVVRISWTYNRQEWQSEEQFLTEKDKLILFLNTDTNITSWVFQLERGEEEGRLHYQGHCKLVKRKRLDQLYRQYGSQFLGIHLSPSSRAGNSDAEFYCTKEEGRVEGPWYDGDYIVPDYSAFTEPYGWQIPLWNMVLGKQIERKIFWVWEAEGKQGKSTFTRWCIFKKKAMKIVLSTADNLMNLIIKAKPQRGYILDLPRTCEGENMRSTWQAIEEIKGQVITCTKYEGGTKLLPMIPHIIVFANYPMHPKDKAAMSKDRWVQLKITDGHLFTEEGHPWYGDAGQTLKRKEI